MRNRCTAPQYNNRVFLCTTLALPREVFEFHRSIHSSIIALGLGTTEPSQHQFGNTTRWWQTAAALSRSTSGKPAAVTAVKASGCLRPYGLGSAGLRSRLPCPQTSLSASPLLEQANGGFRLLPRVRCRDLTGGFPPFASVMSCSATAVGASELVARSAISPAIRLL